jgi:TolB-like protein/lipopolysaccharide biosynthesis regulator YciM
MTNSPSEKSIAVLPFENLSKDEENAFFAGGVQDEILTNLAKIADLKVISRTSVIKYKSGLERNLREIAKTLGVSYVVEGSVQRAGDRVRVSAQLIDARSDTHLWADHYDRDVADIFAIQSEIAEQIADQLRAKLSPSEKAAIAERPTSDLVAYAYFTKAKEIDVWGNWEGAEKSLNQKVELLEKAIQRDPNFALAYCALAKAQIYLAVDPKQFESAKKAAEAALRLRPDLGEAHLELGRYYFHAGTSTGDSNHDYDRAREELAIVRRKLPNNAEALWIEAMIGRHENRWDASLANLKKANALDPRNNELGWDLWRTYFEMRRYSELQQFITKEASGGPVEDPWDKMMLAQIKLAQGDPVAAQSLVEQVPLDFSPDGWIWSVRFKAALYLRDYNAANRLIAATPAKYADGAFDLGHGSENWAYGLVARARRDKQKALAAFAAARQKMEAQWGDKPKDTPYWSDLAKLDAGLGRKEEAIREAQHAVELQPITKDALNGPTWVANLALVYAWTGERDRALEQLEKVATLPGYGPTYGDLLLNPCWDDLRGDPRFDKIVAAAKAASKFALEPLEKSIAVLPLENLSGDSSQEYFADGITEALITDLSRITATRIMSRSSVMQYKGDRKPLAQIARELKVDTLLTGSVARSGERVRVAVQLVDPSSNRNLWADSYDRDLSDVLALQRKLARDVVGQIQLKPQHAQQHPDSIARRVNAEAYDQYLRGRFYLNRQTKDDNEAATDALERAVTIDSTFADAYAALAQAYVWKLFLFAPNDQQSAEKAFVAAEKALALEPDSAAAHLARGRLLWTPANRFPHEKAIQEYRRALEFDPTLDEARNQLALVYCHIGAFDQALQQAKEAVATNPNNNLAQFRIGQTLNFKGKYEEALSVLRGIPPEANPALVGHQIAWALFNLGRPTDASATLDKLLKDYPEDTGGVFTSIQAVLAASAGEQLLAEAKIKSAVERGKGYGHFHHTAYQIACAYALMNKPAQAIKWLEAAADDGFPCYPLFDRDTNLDSLRQDERFVTLLIKLKQQWEHYRTVF